ncbi:protein of unknown function [Cnuella takakiae]|uniref:DUF4268 domain-containing protein n=1 Tax=Cnuella takakiae TaxID=1302690 RepID=A0A1M5BMN3_9BACT|nr:DUF4268 domain-containing protein [Cnuella takakiae]OLY93445.1 hypothetical protein BUE76_17300 [Cnuella takakiae]SHF43665.1 protein of unknown function [Cnuella takakiae]
MYARNEASQIRQEFWTAFGLYMHPVLSAEGEKINWVNYKTGEKNLHFRMDAGNRSALIAIELRHHDDGLRQIYYEQLLQLKPSLEAHLQESWSWEPAFTDDHGRTISRVVLELDGVSVMRKDDWPKLVSFLKPRIIALDAFWSEARYFFEALRS